MTRYLLNRLRHLTRIETGAALAALGFLCCQIPAHGASPAADGARKILDEILLKRPQPLTELPIEKTFRVENSDQIEIIANTMKDTRPLKRLTDITRAGGSVRTRQITPDP